jgi:DNA-binding protein HU-beta
VIKEDIVESVAREIGLPKHECLHVVDSIIESVKEILEAGRKIEIREFGTFSVVDRKAKIGRIIATGGTVVVPPRRAPKFLPGRILKELVNAGPTPAHPVASGTTGSQTA